MLDSNQLKTKTGELGERIVSRYFRNLGLHVEESFDLFDRKKDMIIDGNHTCEVKTQQAWHIENAFTIKKNQLQKCMDVDKLIFVETPSKYNGNKVYLYDFPKEKRRTATRTTSDGRFMHLFFKRDSVLLEVIDDLVIVNQFKRYTLSGWS